MPTLTAEHLIDLLTRYIAESGESIDLLLVGALALHAYGVPHRATRDVHAELQGPLAPLMEYLMTHDIPADLTQNFSGWSVVAMPPGYRDRTIDFVKMPKLHVRVLSPLDFVIAKLRRGIDVDLDDALLVARHHHISADSIRTSARAALVASPQDTALFCSRRRSISFVRASRHQSRSGCSCTTLRGLFFLSQALQYRRFISADQ